MPTRLVFRCEHCGVRAEGATERALEAQLQEFLFGEYLDVEPGHWLHWTGNGKVNGPLRPSLARAASIAGS